MMTTVKDVLIFICMLIGWVSASVAFSTVNTQNTLVTLLLFVLPFLIFVYAWWTYSGKKELTKFVAEEFADRGFIIKSERGLYFYELYTKYPLDIKIGVNPSLMQLMRLKYKRTFHRIFKVENRLGKEFELTTEIKENWNNSIEIDIISSLPDQAYF